MLRLIFHLLKYNISKLEFEAGRNELVQILELGTIQKKHKTTHQHKEQKAINCRTFRCNSHSDESYFSVFFFWKRYTFQFTIWILQPRCTLVINWKHLLSFLGFYNSKRLLPCTLPHPMNWQILFGFKNYLHQSSFMVILNLKP